MASRPPDEESTDVPSETAADAENGERYLVNLRQLTFGGENAEAYFAPDGSRLIFQSTRADVPCDQIFTMRLDGSDLQMVSSGAGRTTCGYFYPDGESMLYASTHLSDAECPPPPSFEMGYVWPIYDSYDIFRTNPDGTELTRPDRHTWLRCRGHNRADRTHRLYERSGWGHGDIFHEGRRFRRAATYESAGARRRPVLFAGWIEDCVPRTGNLRWSRVR